MSNDLMVAVPTTIARRFKCIKLFASSDQACTITLQISFRFCNIDTASMTQWIIDFHCGVMKGPLIYIYLYEKKNSFLLGKS